MRLQCVKHKFFRLIEFAQHLIINATKNIKLVTIQHIQGIMRANLFKQMSIYSETSKPNPFRTKTFVWNRQVFDLDRLNSQNFLILGLNLMFQLTQDSGLFRVQITQDSVLFRVQFTQDSG